MREKDLKNIVAILRDLGPASLYRDDLGDYAVVYHRDAHLSDEALDVVAMGMLVAVDSACIVLRPLSEADDFAPMAVLVRIPWDKIGFLWTQPIDSALAALRAGDKPKFMN